MNLGGTMPCRSLIASNSQPKTQKKKTTRAMRTTNHILGALECRLAR
jgi:hypothetical protein